MNSGLKQLLRAALALPLGCGPLRRGVAGLLRQRHYGDLHVNVPLGQGLVCPICHADHWLSYQHIFVDGEYDHPLAALPLPSRWIDLGCHAGHFSLDVLLRRRKAGLGGPTHAVLGDADARVRPSVERLIELNALGPYWRFEYGLVTAPGEKASFAARDYMTSGRATEGEPGRPVPRLAPETLVRALPPPYDLVKLDIEGGEHDFLLHYTPVWQHAAALLLEWHGWHGGGGRPEALVSLAAKDGFRLTWAEEHPDNANQPPERHMGLLLLQRA